MIHEYKVETNYPSQAFFLTEESATHYLDTFIKNNNRYEIRVTKATIKKVKRNSEAYGTFGYSLIEKVVEFEIS